MILYFGIFFLGGPWGWMVPLCKLQDFPNHFSAGRFSCPAVLCSTDLWHRQWRWCKMSSHSAAAELCIQQLRETNKKQDFPQQASDFSEMNHCNGTCSWGGTVIYTKCLEGPTSDLTNLESGTPSSLHLAPSSSWFPFSLYLLEIMFLLLFCAGWILVTARPRNLTPFVLFATNATSFTCSPASGNPGELVFASCCSLGEMPSQEFSSSDKKSPSSHESILEWEHCSIF